MIPITEDGKRLFPGATLFAMKATHGLPLDFALDRIINDAGMAVDWGGFIDAARENGWWDFQTIEAMGHALSDALLPRDVQREIVARAKLYMLANPHPGTIPA